MDNLKNLQIPSGTFGGASRLVLGDILLILGALVALTLILIVWARYIRKQRRRRTRASSSKPHKLVPVEQPDDSPDEELEPGTRRRRKFRKQRREHRGRNPTLAETGGLPPKREGNPANPPS
jgi:flagellar biosynthesis/type III secretory pathway M-ring protein FliF/YscJ